ncbi:hypothetical protein [Streptomyces nitrosporeus]|uniref:hypothetical protein n=1 Tax=Streptomyces nitrosporeus TaxID=28894 RepID=UPI00331B3F90
MSLILPENASAQPEPSRPSPRLTWTDLALLTVVLGSLVVLLVCGVELPESVAIVGVAGLISAELRRRITS